MSLRKLLGLGNPGRAETPLPTGAIPRPVAPPASGVGLYGKLPVQADFVRLNAGGFASAGFDQWLEDGVGALAGARATPSESLVAFFAYSPGFPNACLGMLGPSRDKVGRQFPVALFVYLDPAMTALAPFVGSALGGFLFQAQATVSGLPASESSVTAEALAALAPPDLPSQLAAAEEAGRQLTQTRLDETLDVVFGNADPPAREHALATCLAACATARGRFPEKAAITLELPAADDRARDFWLAFIAAALSWNSGAPSWLWDDRADRLLLALGPPHPNLFLALAVPDWAGARHWVIRPQLPETAPTAALPSGVQQALATADATVAHLLAAVANAGA